MPIDTKSRHRTRVGGNVFLDLGFSRREAKRLLKQADAQIDEPNRLKQQLNAVERNDLAIVSCRYHYD